MHRLGAGPFLVVDPTLYEYTDPRNEPAVVARWAPVLASIGAVPLTVRDVPRTPERITLDGIPWTVELLPPGEHRVPPTVSQRFSEAAQLGIPITYWVVAKEHVPQPTFLLGAERPGGPTARRPLAASRAVPAARTLQLPPHGDPLLYCVIATAWFRGLWATMGKYQD
jgi:hypothetical protein